MDHFEWNFMSRTCLENYEKHAPRVSQVIAAFAKVSCKHGLWLIARVNNKSVRCQLIQLTFSNALKPVAKRIWTSDPSLRRAPTYCHSLSIWGKVNPYGTLLKTVSDSIWVILNTPSVKLCKALKVSWLFAPANNRGMPWYYHRHLLYDHHASYVRSW